MKYTNIKIKLRAFLAVLVMLAFAVSATAQKISLTGVVRDAVSGETILGANILEKGTTNGTITNLDGEFSITVSPNAILVVKYVGYKPQEIPVAGQKNLVIKLQEDAVALSEVVAIGYGTVKKNDATGSVTAIKPDKMNKGLTTNAQDMIMGKIAGVSVTTGGGTPGSGATIRIRGGSSLNASNDPLIVIDGLPLDNNGIKGVANPLSAINPNDIESFTVLKDASATAIYGSRASNGVIIITTKKGEKGSKPKVSYDGNASMSNVKRTIEVMNGDEFRTLVTNLFSGTGQTDIDARKALGTDNTDWQSLIYRTAFSQEHNITVAGGLKNTPYRAALGYNNQDGILKTSNFERFTGSLNLSPSFFDNHLKINVNAKGMIVNNRFADNGVVGGAARMDPTHPAVNSPDTVHNRFGGYWEWYDTKTDGTFKSVNNMATRNPLAILEQKEDISNAKSFIGSADIDYKLHFFPDLRVHLNLALDNSTGKQSLFIPTTSASDYPWGRTGWDEQSKTNKMLNFYTQYTKEIGKTNFDVMAGYEWQHFYREGESEYRGLIIDDTNKNGSIDEEDDYFNHIYPDATRWKTESYLISFFGRFNYSYNNKYLVTGTLRNDGTSRFSNKNGNRWGLFPAFAAAWKMHEESFIKNIDPISEMKVSLGYGVTGQQDINQGDYPYIPVYTTSINGAYYQFGNDYVTTARPDAFNSKIKWESTTTYNARLDVGFLSNRITSSLEYYHRITNDLINVVQVPAGTNFKNKVISNVGSLVNKGVEFTLNAKPIAKKDITLDLGFNLTYNQNQITKLTTGTGADYYIPAGGTFQGTVQVHTVGQPANTFWVYQQKYNASGKPIEEGAPNPDGGVYKATDAFVDRVEDGIINDKDKYYYHHANPDFMLGFSGKLIYKKFDVGFTLRSNIGNYVFNGVAAGSSDLGTAGVFSLGFLSNKNKSALETNFIGTGTSMFMSDYYIQNASFVKCDNITIGYSFSKLFNVISSGRIFATVQNPFVITGYKGLDPEIFGGIDQTIYPRPLMTIVGVSLNF
ncbi:MAG: TonB-dependent receptor [Paludibacter sp.]